MYQSIFSNKTERGQGMVEFALILVLVAIIGIAVLMMLDSNTEDVYSSVNDTLSGISEEDKTWILCASERGYCDFSGTSQVRYGANDIWVTGTYTDGVPCNNSIFGDPVWGVGKACYVYQVALDNPSTGKKTWTGCASEGGICSFSGTALVSYGADGVWVTKEFTNGVQCNNSVFGDPVWGVRKSCFVYQ